MASSPRRPFFRRRKSCPFSGANAPKIDYKDMRLLSRYISERGKIVPSRITVAALGWGLDGGAIAAGIAIAVLAVVAEPVSALVFAGSVAVPAWVLAAFSVSPLARYLKRLKPDAPVHAPLGAIVSLAALLGMLRSLAVLTTVIAIYGGLPEAPPPLPDALTPL